MKYSIIVPVYNEEQNVGQLHAEVVSVMNRLNEEYEVIFINDGSRDQTLKELKKLSPIKIINLRRNYGQTAALDAGFQHAQGGIYITLDADLQNDPRDIPKILKKLAEGYDVVAGWRHSRRDSFTKRFVSRGAEFFRKFLIDDGIHDSGCTLRAYRAECFKNDSTRLYGEMHRFIPGILKWQGFIVTEVKVNHRQRRYGKTKYSWKRMIKGLVDMVNLWFWRRYSNRPVHIFGGLGFALMTAGSTTLLVLLLLRAFKIISLSKSVWPLLSVFMILMGVQLFASGLLADMLMKTYYSQPKKSVYNIKEIIIK